MQEEYFKFYLYGETWGSIAQSGNYIFQDKNNKIGINDALPFLVFHYVTNYNLDDLELFFKLAGFVAFTEEEIPSAKKMHKVINIPKRVNAHRGWFGGFDTEEKAKQFIESKLGENLISKFKEIKREQLLYKRASLLASLENIKQELGDDIPMDEISPHQ